MCYSCVHLTRPLDPNHVKPLMCEAYPEAIPWPILLSEVDHRKPHEGDSGIQFEQDPKQPIPHLPFPEDHHGSGPDRPSGTVEPLLGEGDWTIDPELLNKIAIDVSLGVPVERSRLRLEREWKALPAGMGWKLPFDA
jgi:hypothetical protein